MKKQGICYFNSPPQQLYFSLNKQGSDRLDTCTYDGWYDAYKIVSKTILKNLPYPVNHEWL